MKQNIRKLLSLTLALSMALGMSLSSNAAVITTSGGSGSASLELSTTEDGTLDGDLGTMTISVMVPTSLPMAMGTDGAITTADDVTITNLSHGSVRVSEISIEAESGWTLDEYTDRATFASKKVNSQIFAFGIQLGDSDMHYTDDSSTSKQTLMSTADDGGILSAVEDEDNNTCTVTYDALVSAFSTEQEETSMASVTFTVEWNT